ncbi:MAG: peptidase S10 [Gemmatimonadetes bacterium]|nr:peptidase S10 [Gemmatimonadota bacterium]
MTHEALMTTPVMTRHLAMLPLFAWSLLAPLPATAQQTGPAAASPPAVDTTLSVTQHQITVGGRVLRYTATAGYLPMRAEDGAPEAWMFFIAYTADAADRAARPVTFTYNGGPGSSSVWLHMGSLGPRRVRLTDTGDPMPPPAQFVDNEDTWLGFTDLVFIDPVLTGFSRPAEGKDKSQFTGVEEDIRSVGDFIRRWTTRWERWPSPKFLAGESYGTFRSAGVAQYLQQRHGMYINGISLISSVLDLKTLVFTPGHDLPYALYLPAYTAVAWYHRKLPADLQALPLADAVQRARQFADNEYVRALVRGSALPPDERARVRTAVARFSGLSEDFVERADLRVSDARFFKELARADGETIGRLDARFRGKDRDAAGESIEADPSYAAIQGPFTGVVNEYLRNELNYQNDLTYEVLGGRVQPWNWYGDATGYTNLATINMAERLRQAMTQNPALRVWVANGWYDLATPFSATEYTFRHLGGDPALTERVHMTYYESGHMMYIHAPSRRQFTEDARAFYAATLKSRVTTTP